MCYVVRWAIAPKCYPEVGPTIKWFQAKARIRKIMRSWRPWIAPWDVKKRTKRKKSKYLADKEEGKTTFVTAHTHKSDIQLKYPNPVLVGPVGEAPTIVFPKVVPSKNEESKISAFRLNTRQGYSYKRHVAGHVQEKNRELRNIKRDARNKNYQYIDHIDRKPDKHVFRNGNHFLEIIDKHFLIVQEQLEHPNMRNLFFEINRSYSYGNQTGLALIHFTIPNLATMQLYLTIKSKH